MKKTKSSKAKESVSNAKTTDSEKTFHRYSDEKLAEFRERLISDREKAEAEKIGIKERKTSLCSSYEPGDDGDRASYGTEKQNLIRELERIEGVLNNIKKALALVEQKTYGICRETGKLIPEERLIRVPFATLCAEAKNDRGK